MPNAKAMGRMAAKIDESDRRSLQAAKIKAIEDDVLGQKTQLELHGRVYARQEQEILGEIQRRGNLSRQDLKQNLYMGMWRFTFVFLSVPIEFYFAYLTFSYFNWGEFFSIAAAIGFVAISLEIVDQYITWYRKNYPEKGDRLFHILSSLGIVILILVIFLSADIRQHLHQAIPSISSASLEVQIKNAEKFYNNSSGSFNYLMAAFTGAIILSSGICLHEAHNRLLLAIPLLRQYRRLARVRAKMTETAGLLNKQDQRVSGFLAEFEQGLAEGKLKLRKKQKKPGTRNRREAFMKTIATFFTHPLTLIVLGICIFLALKGVAHGTEWIVNLDISKSVETKDYTGKETGFSKNVQAVEEIIRNRLAPGDRIYAVGITKYSFSRPYIFLNHKLTDRKGASGEGLAKDKLVLIKKWHALDLKPNAKGTDIFGAIILSSMRFENNQSEKVLVILSDMRNCSRILDIESPDRIAVDKALNKVENAGLIPDLKKVKVSCLGVHSSGKTPVYWQSLKDFWTQYFQKAGAAKLVFTMGRGLNHE